MTTAIVFTCSHATPEVSNDRFTWLGKFIYDVKPDYVVDLGDGADMLSLNTHDTRYPKAIAYKSYEKDINQYNDAQERLRHLFKANKRAMPRWYGFEGNHENRIKKALAHDPQLEGSTYGISFKHLETDRWFNEYHEYHNSAPAIHDYDGVSYAHYFSSGNYGRAISGLHHAHALLVHRASSSTCGHSHKRDIKFKDNAYPNPAISLVAGCYKGQDSTWAGQSNSEWWQGVIVKHGLQDGYYDPEFVSIKQLERMYK